MQHKSQHIPLVHTSLLASVFTAKNLWSGSKSLISTTCWMVVSTRTLPGYPIGSLCCGDPAALGLQVRFLYVLQQIIDGMVAGTWAAVGLVYLLVLSYPHHQSEHSSIVQANSPPVETYTIRTSSIVLPLGGAGATLQGATAGEGQGQFCFYNHGTLLYLSQALMSEGWGSISSLAMLPHVR